MARWKMGADKMKPKKQQIDKPEKEDKLQPNRNLRTRLSDNQIGSGNCASSESLKKLCKHCGMDLKIRNPSGFCDHLYYPENCSICEKRVEGESEKENSIRRDATLRSDKSDVSSIGVHAENSSPNLKIWTYEEMQFEQKYNHTKLPKKFVSLGDHEELIKRERILNELACDIRKMLCKQCKEKSISKEDLKKVLDEIKAKALDKCSPSLDLDITKDSDGYTVKDLIEDYDFMVRRRLNL